MKIYKQENVLEAARARIRMLFQEFEEVIVGFSGGKDSTVTFQLALATARELDRLPLKVMFIDQEAEWQGTIDYVKEVMSMPEVQPLWFQMPMVITNNASSYERYARCWDPAAQELWIHPQDPLAITTNRYGTERFHELFEAIFRVEFSGKKACYLAGVRTEEAPKRFVSLTGQATYKWITWGKKLYAKEEHYTFYPLYDWSYTDVWKYLHDNKIPYNRVYDEMYRHGANVNDMRISNLHHETAIQVLLLVQEIEPQTWNRVTRRIEGANTIKHIQKNSFQAPKDLPYMFANWEEYAEHLMRHVIQEEEHRVALKKQIAKKRTLYTDEKVYTKFWQVVINTILSADWDFTKIANFEMMKGVYTYRKWKQGKRDRAMFHDMTYLSPAQIQELIEYNQIHECV